MFYPKPIATLLNLAILILLTGGFSHADYFNIAPQNAISNTEYAGVIYLGQLALNADQDSSNLVPDAKDSFKPTPMRAMSIAEKLAALDGKYIWDKDRHYLKIRLTNNRLKLEKYTKDWKHVGVECTFPKKSHICSSTGSPYSEYTLSDFGIQRKTIQAVCVTRYPVGRVCGSAAGLGSQTIIKNYSFQN